MKRSTNLKFGLSSTIFLILFSFGFSSSKSLNPQNPTGEPVIWSDWAAIERSTDSDQTLVFHTYILAGTPPKSINPINFNPRRGKDITLKYHAELFQGAKSLGVICEGLKPREAREIYMPNGSWGTYGSNFKYQGMDGNRKAWLYVKTDDLKDGTFEIKTTLTDTAEKLTKRSFKFQVKGGKLIGDSSITEAAFKKKHGIKRLERTYTFLKAEE